MQLVKSIQVRRAILKEVVSSGYQLFHTIRLVKLALNEDSMKKANYFICPVTWLYTK